MNEQKNMQQRLLAFVKDEKIALSKKRLLVAVSGGLDSMVLLHLLHAMGFKIGVAHCNFQLRGDESDQDFEFVKKIAEHLNVPFHSTTFDTKKEMDTTKKGVQEVARNLRYAWFEEIRKSEKYDWVAVAHHADDQVETILANFIRGTGIKGLRGMKAQRDKIVRPLLFATRKEIADYATAQQIEYREDSSNAKTDYQRNKIRHELLPLIQQLNPSFSKTLLGQQTIYQQLESTHQRFLEKKFRLLFTEKENSIHISIALLKKTPHAALILFDFLRNYNFNASSCEDIVQTLEGISGKQFWSDTHRIIKDRRVLVLEPKSETNFSNYTISLVEKKGSLLTGENKLNWETKPMKDVTISKDKKKAYLNADELGDTLTLRHWKKGDYFYPFGMNNKKKKVSKYFKDQKIAISDKEKIWILAADQKITWVLNHRTDERFKITPATKEVVCLEWV